MIHDKMENLLKYIPKAKIQTITEFLKSVSSEMKEGRYEIDGEDVYARIMSYETKVQGNCEIEAHDIYCDIQFSLIGSEGISIYQRENLKIKSVDSEKDFITLEENGVAPQVSLENIPNYFTLIFPREAHRPQEAKNGICKSVKKGVIKIKESCYE